YQDALDQYNKGHPEGAKPPQLPKITVDVVQDFGKRTWSDLGKYMVEHHKVYFGHEVLEQARRKISVPDGLSDEEFMKANSEGLCRDYLPKDFKGLIDSPMRSAVGTVVWQLENALDYQEKQKDKKMRVHLDGENMVEYLEFLIGDQLTKKHVTIEPG